MKKAILTLALIMSIGATQVSLASSAPKHRYHPTTQQVDKQVRRIRRKRRQMGRLLRLSRKLLPRMKGRLEAYSDTTSTDTASYDDFDNDDNPCLSFQV